MSTWLHCFTFPPTVYKGSSFSASSLTQRLFFIAAARVAVQCAPSTTILTARILAGARVTVVPNCFLAWATHPPSVELPVVPFCSVLPCRPGIVHIACALPQFREALWLRVLSAQLRGRPPSPAQHLCILGLEPEGVFSHLADPSRTSAVQGLVK